jgi:hypothetical protein
MALVRSLLASDRFPGFTTQTDLKWSVSHANGVTLLHLFSDGSDTRQEQKISQVYTFRAEQARELAAIIVEQIPEHQD